MTRDRRPRSHRVTIAWRYPEDWRARALLRRAARAALAAQAVDRCSLEVAVVAAAEIAAHHRRFLGLNTPTDVLTFDLGDSGARLDLLLIVCADVARAASRAPRRTAWIAELALYVVHGVLHGTGHDDRTPAAARRMHAREDEILRSLGFAPRDFPAPR